MKKKIIAVISAVLVIFAIILGALWLRSCNADDKAGGSDDGRYEGSGSVLPWETLG